MGRSTKLAWLEGPGDLREADVEDVPVPGESVRVRAMPAAYSNQATSEAMEFKQTPQGEQVATINKARMEVIQFAQGVIDPQFTLEEAQKVAERFGPAFRKVIDKIDELSAVDKEAVEQAQATFPAGERHPNGSAEAVADDPPAGDRGPVLRG